MNRPPTHRHTENLPTLPRHPGSILPPHRPVLDTLLENSPHPKKPHSTRHSAPGTASGPPRARPTSPGPALTPEGNRALSLPSHHPSRKNLCLLGTPLTPPSVCPALSAVCCCFRPRPGWTPLPRSMTPGCSGSSQGHWPGLSGGAEGPQRLERMGGIGEGGAGRGCRKPTYLQEAPWEACGPALERGNECFPAPLSPLSSCPWSPLPESPRAAPPCVPPPPAVAAVWPWPHSPELR